MIDNPFRGILHVVCGLFSNVCAGTAKCCRCVKCSWSGVNLNFVDKKNYALKLIPTSLGLFAMNFIAIGMVFIFGAHMRHPTSRLLLRSAYRTQLFSNKYLLSM